MLGGKVAVVFGYGEVGKGCAQALRGRGAASSSPKSIRSARCRRRWKAMRSTRSRTCWERADIFHHGDGHHNIITAEQMSRMKDKAIVGNIGHFDNEIDMAGLKKFPGVERINIKPQYDEFKFPDGHSVMVLAEGRLLNLGCATGHPSFVMSASFTNQVNRAARAADQHRQVREEGLHAAEAPRRAGGAAAPPSIRHADVVRLIFVSVVLDAEMIEVQPRHLLVEVLRQHVDLLLVLAGVGLPARAARFTWLVNDADMDEARVPVAHPRFSRRPSARTITLWPSGNLNSSYCGLMLIRSTPGNFFRPAMSISFVESGRCCPRSPCPSCATSARR